MLGAEIAGYGEKSVRNLNAILSQGQCHGMLNFERPGVRVPLHPQIIRHTAFGQKYLEVSHTIANFVARFFMGKQIVHLRGLIALARRTKHLLSTHNEISHIFILIIVCHLVGGSEELRYVAVSTEHSLEMAQYPDSGKFGVKAEFGTAPDGTPKRVVFSRRENQPVDFWEGE